MKKVVSIGSANVDIFKYVDRFCDSDEEVAIKEMMVASGGQGANIASGLGMLGHESYFFGNLGNDNYTGMLKKDFKKANVDCSYTIPTNLPNNTVHCIVDKEGKRHLYTYSSSDFSASHFPEKLYSSDLIVFSSIIKEDAIETYAEIACKAKKNNTITALVASGLFTQKGLDALKPLLKHIDYLFASKKEIEQLTKSINNFQSLTDIVTNVIMTKGKDGAALLSNKHLIESEGKKMKNIVDTTGAGDIFAAAFLSAVLDGKDHKYALDFANNAAALSITKKGARAMPSIEEIKRIKT